MVSASASYGSIVAPHKELLIIDSEVRLLFNEDLDVVLPPLLDGLARSRRASLMATLDVGVPDRAGLPMVLSSVHGTVRPFVPGTVRRAS